MLTNRIIVIGGSGFLGSNIVTSLQKSGIKNVAYGDLISNKYLDCEYVKLDVLDLNNIIKKLNNSSQKVQYY